MPLNWSISDCKDWESLKSDEEWPITNALIWVSMSIGIRDITEKTIPEYFARLCLWQDLVGEMGHQYDAETKKWSKRYITIDDLKKRIGLHTNAGSMTRAQWLKSITEYIKRELDKNKTHAERDIKFSEVDAV